MIEDTGKAAPPHAPARYADALLLAAGGVTAAFGAASCCALPLLLGSLGLGSAWLVTVAWIAAPHRVALWPLRSDVLQWAAYSCGVVVALPPARQELVEAQ